MILKLKRGQLNNVNLFSYMELELELLASGSVTIGIFLEFSKLYC